MQLSPVAKLTWELASVEAAGAKSEFIEPEHLLAVLTKLRQFGTDAGAQVLEGQGADLGAHRPELELVGEVLDDAGVEADSFRHELPERLGKGTHGVGTDIQQAVPQNTVEACKWLSLGAGRDVSAAAHLRDSAAAHITLQLVAEGWRWASGFSSRNNARPEAP